MADPTIVPPIACHYASPAIAHHPVAVNLQSSLKMKECSGFVFVQCRSRVGRNVVMLYWVVVAQRLGLRTTDWEVVRLNLHTSKLSRIFSSL